MNLCQYKNYFGAPNTGIHKYRILGFAAVDLGLTILAAIFISYIFKVNPIISIFGFMILSVITHKIFCVDTASNKALGF